MIIFFCFIYFKQTYIFYLTGINSNSVIDMIPKGELSNAQSLTGQAKIESLNSIYNRVAKLKSKHVSRRLKIKQIGRDGVYQSNNVYSSNNIPPLQQQSHQDNTNTQSNDPFQTENFPYTLRRQSLEKLTLDRQSDNVETNFWPSQNLIRQSRRIKSVRGTNGEGVVSEKDRRRLVGNGEGKRVDGGVGKQRSNNKRRYLLSEYAKQQADDPDCNPTVANHQSPHAPTKRLLPFPKRPLNIKPSCQTSLSHSTRPLTSNTISGQHRSTSYRISQSSKWKHSFSKRTTTMNNNNNNIKTMISSGNDNSVDKSVRVITSSRVSILKCQQRHKLYKQQISKFQQLYQHLSRVLSSLNSTNSVQIQHSISLYSNFIHSNSLSFIDDFIQTRQIKLQKLVKTTRLQQSLSICYLFLQIAQQRIYDNQSYLVNFIGHSMSNLLLLVRLYVINQRREGFELSGFQVALKQLQKSTFSSQLTLQSDVLLRIQHNTQILTMIHKKLGRNNQTFQSCIIKFLKVSERQKYSCQMSAHYIFEFLAMHIHELGLIGVSHTLELAPKPYLAPTIKQYTLVIQPLGILEKNGILRPYVRQFLKWARKNFDLVLWTWEQTLKVEQLFSQLSQFITTKLYRHHCKIQDNIFTKDLSRLGRSLDRTMIIDFDKRIFQGFESNGIQCRWMGNKNDRGLLLLSQILQQMVASQTCVQDTIVFYAQQLYSVRGY